MYKHTRIRTYCIQQGGDWAHMSRSQNPARFCSPICLPSAASPLSPLPSLIAVCSLLLVHRFTVESIANEKFFFLLFETAMVMETKGDKKEDSLLLATKTGRLVLLFVVFLDACFIMFAAFAHTIRFLILFQSFDATSLTLPACSSASVTGFSPFSSGLTLGPFSSAAAVAAIFGPLWSRDPVAGLTMREGSEERDADGEADELGDEEEEELEEEDGDEDAGEEEVWHEDAVVAGLMMTAAGGDLVTGVMGGPLSAAAAADAD